METRILIPEQLKLVSTEDEAQKPCNLITSSSSPTASSRYPKISGSSCSNEKDVEKPSSSFILQQENGCCESESSNNTNSSTIQVRNRRKRSRTSRTIKRGRNKSQDELERNPVPDSSDSDVSKSYTTVKKYFESENEKVDHSDSDSDYDKETFIRNAQTCKTSSNGKCKIKFSGNAVTICAKERIPRGTVLCPNEGEVKVFTMYELDPVPQDDVRLIFGCFDRLMEDPLKPGQKIRLCNWLRFVKQSPSKANRNRHYESGINLIAKLVDKRPVLEFVRDLAPGEEVMACFDLESASRSDFGPEGTKSMDWKVATVTVKREPEEEVEAPLDLSKPSTATLILVPPTKRSPSAETTIIQCNESNDAPDRFLITSSPSPHASSSSRHSSPGLPNKEVGPSSASSPNPQLPRHPPASVSLFQPYLYNSNTNTDNGDRFQDRKATPSSRFQEPLVLTPPVSSSKSDRPFLSSSTDSNNSNTSALNSPDSITCFNQRQTSFSSFIDRIQQNAGHTNITSSTDKRRFSTHFQYGYTHFGRNCGGGAVGLSLPNNGNSSINNNTLLRPILRTRGRERSLLPCEVCSKAFDRPSLLKRHMRTHTGEKPHVCDVCSKGFSTSSSLNTHRRIHSGEKPHQCPVCGKRFTASSNLYYHRMTHNKEKPHKCLLCGKSFPTPGDLKSHQYVHSGSWPFSCRICNRGFSKQTNLRNHLLLHSGDKPHTCKVCNKKFALACNLRAHFRTHEEESNSIPVSSSCTNCQIHSDEKCRSCMTNMSEMVNKQDIKSGSGLLSKAPMVNMSDITIPQPFTSTTSIPGLRNRSPDLQKMPFESAFHPASGVTHIHGFPSFTSSLLQSVHQHPHSHLSLASTMAAMASQRQHQQQPAPHSPFRPNPSPLSSLTRSNPFVEQLLEWNWRVAKETAGNLGLMQQKLIESQLLAAQLMSTAPTNTSAPGIVTTNESTGGLTELLHLQQLHRNGKLVGGILGNKISNGDI